MSDLVHFIRKASSCASWSVLLIISPPTDVGKLPICLLKSPEFSHRAHGATGAPFLKKLPVEDRIRLVQDLWDSIANDQHALPLTPDQVSELDRRLDAFEADGETGQPAFDAIANIRKRL